MRVLKLAQSLDAQGTRVTVSSRTASSRRIKQQEAAEAAETRRQAADELLAAATQRIQSAEPTGRRADAGDQEDRPRRWRSPPITPARWR